MIEKRIADFEKSDARVNPPLNISSERFREDAQLGAEVDYQELLIHYQNADWEQCGVLIDRLLLSYPDKQILLDFKADIDVQLLLRKMSQDKSKAKVWKYVFSTLAFLGLLVVTIVVIIYFSQQTLISYQRQLETYQTQVVQVQQENLALLENQARTALQAGKPEASLEIIAKIEQQDPENASLESLRSEADAQLELVEVYDQAMQAMSQENYNAALEIFQQIKLVRPLFRDVDYQIAWIENHKFVLELMAAADKAYQQKNWSDTIQSYEQALALDTSLNSPLVKEQMLYSYLYSIVETLSKENHTIEDLERSGTYYRKAIALIPQDRDYISERERLQQLSLELLISKNYQTAKNLLGDPNHSRSTVAKAISFLKYASELKPDNQEFKSELNKAQLYQSVLINIEQGKLAQAISVLEDLARFDRQYPNGMGTVLLYEAYVAQGLKLYEDGFYLDARKVLELAELIAWEDRENQLPLFLVQINLGNTIGKLENYKDAVSYYAYAFNAIEDITEKVDNQFFVDILAKASELAELGDYDEAYSAYLDVIARMNVLFDFQDVNVYTGDNLLYIAQKYQSTIQGIQLYNEVDFPVATRNQTLSIPALP